jgi:hypothetical protein
MVRHNYYYAGDIIQYYFISTFDHCTHVHPIEKVMSSHICDGTHRPIVKKINKEVSILVIYKDIP